MADKENKLEYGVCRVCGCTENDPCYNPAYGCYWWTDKTHTLCSHCAEKEIAENPRTVHCYNSTNGNLERDYGDIPDIVLCFVAQKCKEDAYVTLGSWLRDELELDSMDITEVLIESEKHYGIKAEGQSRDMDTVMDIVDWIWENRKEQQKDNK